ncbi:hypothetical protein BD626DRAFT_569020 [Schizophyllum amplum]|uniref:Uncharacterized protein n=1 Tax=Schizophyllum amplum TaxID=97359 RepID=A0A550CFQ7_9AGAR|nr:hypothetical protein BD626DRAFT_569020 [Auriculariopsis ampla]
MSSIQESGPLIDSDVEALNNWVTQLAVLFTFFGLHACFYFISAYLLMKDGLRESRSRLFLFVCSSAMFFTSLASASMSARNAQLQFDTLAADPPDNTQTLVNLAIAMNTMLRVNFLISDTVVVWRAWVLFPDNMKVRIVLSVCLFGTFAAVIANTVVIILRRLGELERLPDLYSLMLTVPLLITNLTATALMAYKTWNYRDYVFRNFMRKRTKTRAEMTLLILVESGFAYCAIWIIVMAASLGAFTDTQTSILLEALCSICGLYPTFIIIMVGLQRSSVDSLLGDSLRLSSSTARYMPPFKGADTFTPTRPSFATAPRDSGMYANQKFGIQVDTEQIRYSSAVDHV